MTLMPLELELLGDPPIPGTPEAAVPAGAVRVVEPTVTLLATPEVPIVTVML